MRSVFMGGSQTLGILPAGKKLLDADGLVLVCVLELEPPGEALAAPVAGVGRVALRLVVGGDYALVVAEHHFSYT
jgi:hypothetical protein